MKYKYVRQEELKKGDVMKTLWKGHDSLIVGFREYIGPIDFVARIAVFSDGSGMSLEKEHSYEILDDVGELWRMPEDLTHRVQ